MRQIEDFFETGKNKIQCKERLRSGLELGMNYGQWKKVLGDWLDVGAGELIPGEVCR